jgi:predicted RNA-binding protein YlqC (UPF0109 family)
MQAGWQTARSGLQTESGMTTSDTTSVPYEPTQQLLLSIVQMLVDDGNAVEVDCFEENGVTTLNLRVAAADIGKVIGKQGRTARSLRTILSAGGMKQHRRYCLNIQQEHLDHGGAEICSSRR